MSLTRQTIIMNFTTPPTVEDLMVLARATLEALPTDLAEKCENIALQIEEFPDPATEQDLELENPYDLLSHFRRGSEVAPGVVRKAPAGEDALILYRRPILDLWCETNEDLATLIRNIVIGEIGSTFEYSEREIEQPTAAIAANS